MKPTRRSGSERLYAALAAAALGVALLAANPAAAHSEKQRDEASPAPEAAAGQPSGQPSGMRHMPGMANMRMPSMDPVRGRTLFVEKGCVACHAINGVGGHDATALDAHTMPRMMNPFEFAAKMWRMAPAMIYAQEEALGEQILFTGDELSDIIAFVHNDAEQHKLSDADIPPHVRQMMDHSHGEPGGGVEEHREELGHHHDAPGQDMPGHGHGMQ